MSHDPYFRIITTLIGLNVTDTWMIMNHHDLFSSSMSKHYETTNSRKVPIKAFAGMLAGQLIEMSYNMEEDEDGNDDMGEEENINHDSETDMEEQPDIQFKDRCGNIVPNCIHVKDYYDGNGSIHVLARFPVRIMKNNRKRGMVKLCNHCKKQTTCFCFTCMKPLCHSYMHMHTRSCFKDHLPTRASDRVNSP